MLINGGFFYYNYHYYSYGLLGASGCGKTTLLSCIVGTKLLDEGQIRVLGGKPGSPQSGVPGPRVGYMPQVFWIIYFYSYSTLKLKASSELKKEIILFNQIL